MKTGLSEVSYFFLKETVGHAMENYEIRMSQLEMLKTCSKTISDGGVLMAEASTGTGKTFAYLIPSILSKKRAIISTKTINLQEQLVAKDLKFLSSLYSFDYAIAKGRSNYLCMRRLNAFRHESNEESVEYRNILIWASKTEDGDIEDYGLKKPSIWGKVSSDPDACKGRKCGHFNQCFYFRARQKWDKSQILVANHALICLNAMIANDAKILPQADVLVIDEGHALDRVLSEYAGINLSKRGFENILNTLLRMDERGAYKGILSKSPHLFQSVESIRAEMQLLWVAIKNHLKNRETIRQLGELKEVMSLITGRLNSLIHRIKTETIGLFKEDEEIEIKAAVFKLIEFAKELEAFSEGMDGFVRWAEIEENRIALRMAPIYEVYFGGNNNNHDEGDACLCVARRHLPQANLLYESSTKYNPFFVLKMWRGL